MSNEINHRFEHVNGPFDMETGKLVCVPSSKYNDVNLCFRANMHIPFARILLYSSELWVDAKAVFEDASRLGDEIVKRWNEHDSNVRKVLAKGGTVKGSEEGSPASAKLHGGKWHYAETPDEAAKAALESD